MKTIKATLSFSLLLSLFLYSQLSYGLIRYSGGGNGSYQINLAASNAVLSTRPSLGSNGEQYYLISPPNQTWFSIDENTSQASGTVTCREHYILGNSYLYDSYAYHRLFTYLPEAGFSIRGKNVYKINANTFFTLYSNNGITDSWQNITASACSDRKPGPLAVQNFTVHFPFFVSIYVKELPIDGKIIIPQTMLAGYTRMFQDIGTPNIYVTADKAMIKLDLVNSVITFLSKCSSNIDNLNISHQSLNPNEFDSKQTRTVTYQCERAVPVKVKLTLDYSTNGDPQKRVPLTSGNNIIYSELALIIDGQNRGKSSEITINRVKNIEIESHIQGLDAEPGKYTGNAWLIATYL